MINKHKVKEAIIMETMNNITNPRRRKQIEDFFDKDRPAMSKYYQLFERKPSKKELKGEMALLIKADPDFYDPYHILADILFSEGKNKDAEEFLYEAYRRAMQRIVDKEGNFPQRMAWGWLENRHIMRTIQRWGFELWEQGKTEETLTIFRKLLKSNPGDNQGIRFSVLALRLGLKSDYENKFSAEDMPNCVDGFKISSWFDKNSKNFPEEFGWWFKAMEKGEY